MTPFTDFSLPALYAELIRERAELILLLDTPRIYPEVRPDFIAKCRKIHDTNIELVYEEYARRGLPAPELGPVDDPFEPQTGWIF